MDVHILDKIVQNAVQACGVEIYHYEWLPSGRKSLLRVYIDKPGGVTVGDCESVSRELGVLLDLEEVIPSRYVLEVSSPGMDRRLYTRPHFLANLGKEIEVRLKGNLVGEQKKWIGILDESDASGFTISLQDGTKKRVAYEFIDSARLRVQF